jgi:hypothetical protein
MKANLTRRIGRVFLIRHEYIQKSQEANLSDVYFTNAPDQREAFKVGDRVDVYCDHENEQGVRVRDWLVGTVVQVDPKMLAIQFEENVYLTDGWMVPDHVLWCPKNSSNIRPSKTRRRRVRAKTNR